MAINRVDYPANLTAQADFSAHGELIETRFMDQVNAPQWVVSGNIPQGVVLQIGGVVYRADSDTAITGTASDYVKITPSGATASAAYVASLTGATWSAQYNGYYDASSNLYLFDEGKALAAGEIASVFGRYLMQQPNGDVAIGSNLAVAGTFDAATVNTGQGDNELYQMDQAVRTTDVVTFGGRKVAGRLTGSRTQGEIFASLSPKIPTIGDKLFVNGSVNKGTDLMVLTFAERTLPTVIALSGAVAATTPRVDTVNVTESNTSVISVVSLAW